MSKKANVEEAIKVTLSSKKVVLLRQPKIKHQSQAVQVASQKVKSENNLVLGSELQQELLKILLISVDDKTLTGSQKEDLDSIFTIGEYQQCLKVVNKLMSGESEGNEEPTIETVFGNT